MPEYQNDSETKLQQLIDKSHQVLFTARAIFPLQLNPDRLTIDLTKVTVEYRYLFRSEDVRTILLQDIFQVEVVYVLFMATLIINRPDVCKVTFLRKDDAVRAKQIIAGLLLVRRELIKLDEIDPKNLADRIAEIGKTHHPV